MVHTTSAGPDESVWYLGELTLCWCLVCVRRPKKGPETAAGVAVVRVMAKVYLPVKAPVTLR